MAITSANTNSALPDHIAESEVAELLGVGVRRLRNRHLTDEAPRRVRLARGRYIYLAADVAEYIEVCRARTANDSVPVQPVRRGRGRPKGSITKRHSVGGEG